MWARYAATLCRFSGTLLKRDARMPKTASSSSRDSISVVRSKIRQKSVDEWKEVFRGRSLSYLVDQTSLLPHNESLPYPPVHLRTALRELVEEAKARSETVSHALAESRVLPAPDDTAYERAESGGISLSTQR